MVDRLVVQVQDTVNALSLGSTDAYQTDIDQAASVIKDADNSKQVSLKERDHISRHVMYTTYLRYTQIMSESPKLRKPGFDMKLVE